MALSLSCSCGAKFEVEDTFAGQSVTCPECQSPVQAPVASRQPVRTSGYAVAAVVLALVLAFTGIGTALAVLLGCIALVHISQNRGTITGAGYAIFSIVWGTIFTGLFVFAIAKGEVFGVGDQVRERLLGNQVDRSGPLEIRRPLHGFAITRPTARWGVASAKLVKEVGAHCDLMLLQASKDTRVSVSSNDNGLSIEDLRDDMARRFRELPNAPIDFQKPEPRVSDVVVRKNQLLPPTDGAERAELLIDLREAGQSVTFLIRIVRTTRTNKVYVIQGWAQRQRYLEMEGEIRRALDSFKLLNE